MKKEDKIKKMDLATKKIIKALIGIPKTDCIYLLETLKFDIILNKEMIHLTEKIGVKEDKKLGLISWYKRHCQKVGK